MTTCYHLLDMYRYYSAEYENILPKDTGRWELPFVSYVSRAFIVRGPWLKW